MEDIQASIANEEDGYIVNISYYLNPPSYIIYQSFYDGEEWNDLDADDYDGTAVTVGKTLEIGMGNINSAPDDPVVNLNWFIIGGLVIDPVE